MHNMTTLIQLGLKQPFLHNKQSVLSAVRPPLWPGAKTERRDNDLSLEAPHLCAEVLPVEMPGAAS